MISCSFSVSQQKHTRIVLLKFNEPFDYDIAVFRIKLHRAAYTVCLLTGQQGGAGTSERIKYHIAGMG